MSGRSDRDDYEWENEDDIDYALLEQALQDNKQFARRLKQISRELAEMKGELWSESNSD